MVNKYVPCIAGICIYMLYTLSTIPYKVARLRHSLVYIDNAIYIPGMHAVVLAFLVIVKCNHDKKYSVSTHMTI